MNGNSRTPHHLIIHLDYHPRGTLEIRWSYPFTDPPIREHVIAQQQQSIPNALKKGLENIRNTMIARCPAVQRLRVPHGWIEPERRFDILTIIIRDGRRDLPVVRLFYRDVIPGEASIEGQVRIDGRADASSAELEMWDSVRKIVAGIAWEDYQAKFTPTSR
jgi:hypothetical protein